MQNLDPWTKYDEAIVYLRKQDPGSYFDEIAVLMEELIARVVADEARPEPRTQRAVEYEREQNRIKDALGRRMASYSSPAKDGTDSNNRLSDEPEGI